MSRMALFLPPDSRCRIGYSLHQSKVTDLCVRSEPIGGHITGARERDHAARVVHKLLAPALGLLFFLYITLLYTRLSR